MLPMRTMQYEKVMTLLIFLKIPTLAIVVLNNIWIVNNVGDTTIIQEESTRYLYWAYTMSVATRRENCVTSSAWYVLDMFEESCENLSFFDNYAQEDHRGFS